MSDIIKKIDLYEHLAKKLERKRTILLDKGLKSNDPNVLIKAQDKYQEIMGEKRDDEKKSYVIDPMDFVTSLGFKNKAMPVSYETLRRMATVPVINAIIKTRVNQIAAFAEPQKDKYSTGFKIFKKGKEGSKMTKAEQKVAADIENFILNCGVGDNIWAGDDFDTFIRKITKDSLIYDQLTFEVVRNKKGQPVHFFATDASTYRIADSIDEDSYQGREKEAINGYLPTYVQVKDGVIYSEFYPWELCFGIRNADTSVENYGYGISELEELIHTVTAMLWSDEYNRKFFSQGSAPKGIIRINGSVNPAKIQEFKQQWISMMSGVSNSWKTPILEADKMDFINLQSNNRDMEYNKWVEYLIKIATAIYTIDPAEINFPMQGSSDTNTVFESSNESKLKQSKDKGLYPLLKFIQAKINKYLVSQINPEYHLQFVGIDAMTKEKEVEILSKKVASFATLNEVREEAGYNKLDNPAADNPMNGIYSQFKMIEDQKQQEQASQVNPFGGSDDRSQDEDDTRNPFDEYL